MPSLFWAALVVLPWALAGPGPAQAMVAHAPIDIDGDAEFHAQAAANAWPGDGTANDPYQIRGLSISATDTSAVKIANTGVHFVIADNELAAAGGTTYGVQLSGTSAGTVDNNTFDGFTLAVYLNAATGATVSNNTMVGGFYGIAAVSSAGNLLHGNSVQGASFGIFVLFSHESQIVGNTVSSANQRAVYLHHSEDVRLEDNAASGGNTEVVLLLDASRTHWTGGSVTGAPVGIRVRESADVTIQDTLFEDGDLGIHLDEVRATVSDSTFLGLDRGVFVERAHGSRFFDNVVDGNRVGIDLQLVDGVTIDGLVARNGTEAVFAFSAVDLTISGLDARGLQFGARLTLSGDVSIDGSVLLDNDVGLRISDTLDASVTRSVLSGHDDGIVLSRGSGHTIRSNHIEDNRRGLVVTGSDDNLIYDNRFDNEANVAIGGDVENTWAIEPRPGTNIIGGDLVAGNWWHDYRGFDLDEDGIGDVPHGPFGYGDPGSEELAELTGFPYGPEDGYPLVTSAVKVPDS